MFEKRNTRTYALYDGNEKVYIGTANDLDERIAAHRNAGKRFTRAETTSRSMTREGAKRKEEQQLKSFREGHRGRNPRYNKDSDG